MSVMLYWAALIAGLGVAVLVASRMGHGMGASHIAPFLCGLALLIAALMALTHWLCARKGWH